MALLKQLLAAAVILLTVTPSAFTLASPAPGVLSSLLDQLPFFGSPDSNDYGENPWRNKPHRNGKVVRPNVVFILTDDQDLHMQSLDYLPLIKKHLLDRGTLYKKHFCTTALCCPSRVSLWTGRLAHNTNVTDVNPPYGGYPKFVSQGLNDAYLPVWLQSAGYNTYYTGKLFNAHTVENYATPHAAGWTGSDFLLDPYTYSYLNATYQRDDLPPVSYEGRHTVDVLTEKALGLLDEAIGGLDPVDPTTGLPQADAGKPFFIGIAPVAPHSNVELSDLGPNSTVDDIQKSAIFSPPVPAERHAHLFPNAVVPRTPHFNPADADLTSPAADWVGRLPRQTEENVAFNDHFYRQRLRALQGVDELVEAVVARLAEQGLLGSTYVFYTTDNGFHIGQHRLQPGKECGFDDDVNIPLIVRGPGVPQGLELDDVVTTHTDIAPTILGLIEAAGEGLPDTPSAPAAPGSTVADHPEFDGLAIPLTGKDIALARRPGSAGGRHEHVTVEYWGIAASEGSSDYGDRLVFNNTYKAVRVVGRGYSYYYAVWCTNEHELYDLTADPYQLTNLLSSASTASPPALIPVPGRAPSPISTLTSRLDALLFVLKTCSGATCVRPWSALHPAGNVASLREALSPRFDGFYGDVLGGDDAGVRFDRCELGQIADAEGARWKEGQGWEFWENGQGNDGRRELKARWSDWV